MVEERYEALKKYRCKWAPEEVLGVCEAKIKGKNPDEVDCLIYMGNTFVGYIEGLWKVILFMGVQDGRKAELLAELRRAMFNTQLVFDVLVRKLRPVHNRHEREKYSDLVERALERCGDEKTES